VGARGVHKTPAVGPRRRGLRPGEGGRSTLSGRQEELQAQIWKHNRQPLQVKRGYTLRIQAPGGFHLLYSLDDWKTETLKASSTMALRIGFVDVRVPTRQKLPVRFTFFWPGQDRWEGREYAVAVVP
jgi:glucoamylase